MNPQTNPPKPRKFIGVFFECCGVYDRVYLSQDGQRYAGRCPRCMRTLTAQAGPGGTSRRFFRAF